MGRPPKPTAELKLHGAFRKDRHGDRADIEPSNGAPQRPKSLTAIEGGLWDQVVPELVRRKLVGVADTAELVALCETWGLYRASVELAKGCPTDKEIRCAVVAYLTLFNALAGKFGLTAVDLARLKVPKDDKPKGVAARTRA